VCHASPNKHIQDKIDKNIKISNTLRNIHERRPRSNDIRKQVERVNIEVGIRKGIYRLGYLKSTMTNLRAILTRLKLIHDGKMFDHMLRKCETDVIQNGYMLEAAESQLADIKLMLLYNLNPKSINLHVH
jgi:hypothetical protein